VNSFTQRGGSKASGYQLGGGVEARVAERLTLGLEYLYTSLEDDTRVRFAGPAPANNPFLLVNPAGTDFRRSDEEFDFHSVRLVANVRF
jgi:opacity protein-like surface antigen